MVEMHELIIYIIIYLAFILLELRQGMSSRHDPCWTFAKKIDFLNKKYSRRLHEFNDKDRKERLLYPNFTLTHPGKDWQACLLLHRLQ